MTDSKDKKVYEIEYSTNLLEKLQSCATSGRPCILEGEAYPFANPVMLVRTVREKQEDKPKARAPGPLESFVEQAVEAESKFLPTLRFTSEYQRRVSVLKSIARSIESDPRKFRTIQIKGLIDSDGKRWGTGVTDFKQAVHELVGEKSHYYDVKEQHPHIYVEFYRD